MSEIRTIPEGEEVLSMSAENIEAQLSLVEIDGIVGLYYVNAAGLTESGYAPARLVATFTEDITPLMAAGLMGLVALSKPVSGTMLDQVSQ